jgi:2-dehydro-3-deoxy-L-rhamnonate dehydrogenase (NAD+)
VSATSPISRTAIVTGGARGIGRATAVRLAQDGVSVVVVDVEDGADVVREIEDAGGRALFRRTDVTDPDAVGALVDEARSAFGSVDILAAIAGVLGEEHDTARLPLAEYRRVLDVNLTGVLICCQAVLPQMAQRGWGRIVAVTSNAAHGAPGRAHYAASKAGLIGLIKTIAHENARAGVLANLVDPGRALTDMIVPRYDAAYLADPPGHAIGRIADPAEPAEVIAFLCSARNTYAVGAVWDVTGGIENR